MALGKILLSQAEAMVKKREASSPTMIENSRAQAVSFIVRIWKEPGQAAPEYRGWIEHVQSEQRTPFLGLDQISTVIAAYVQALPSEKDTSENG